MAYGSMPTNGIGNTAVQEGRSGNVGKVGEKMTQAQQVVKFMQENGSISTLEAFREFGITRLASRIYELRRAGLEITSETEKSRNRYGEPVHFARYRIA